MIRCTRPFSIETQLDSFYKKRTVPVRGIFAPLIRRLRCEGTVCTATARVSQPATRACRRVVARLGKVTAFAYKGTALTAAELATCNAD